MDTTSMCDTAREMRAFMGAEQARFESEAGEVLRKMDEAISELTEALKELDELTGGKRFEGPLISLGIAQSIDEYERVRSHAVDFASGTLKKLDEAMEHVCGDAACDKKKETEEDI